MGLGVVAAGKKFVVMVVGCWVGTREVWEVGPRLPRSTLAYFLELGDRQLSLGP